MSGGEVNGSTRCVGACSVIPPAGDLAVVE